MVSFLQKIRDARAFQAGILVAILIGAIVIGLETSPEIMAKIGPLLKTIDRLIVGLFVVEALIKIGAEGKRPWRYFKNGWNVFDFIIVVLCLLPASQAFAVMRLVRLLRVLRLITVIPRLRMLVGALARSLPSMGWVVVLLSVVFYVYAVMGVFLFSGNDPMHFGDLGRSFISLLRTVTLEDWTDLMYIQMLGSDVYAIEGLSGPGPEPKAFGLISVLYFGSFVIVGALVMLNLFIGVVLTSMQEEQKALEKQQGEEDEAVVLRKTLARIEQDIRFLREKLPGERR